MEKKATIKEEIKIPDGVQITVEGKTIHVKGQKGALAKVLSHPKIQVSVSGNVVQIICAQSPRRREKALIGTFKAHIRNMIKGVSQGYECKMKTVFSHFPIKTSVEGNQLLIQNFLGERFARRAEILENVKVDIKGESIILTAIDKEKVGQTAANIERATKVKNRDIRVFQDGIYIVKRG
ncbi:MAG: 50S ribosomal protein L6 [Candidatus Thermoplasmatota archaeon]|jgi:large subunit ribosomal protein L6|nr:50S ribosomal protein L6 [Candidatus Thermoplasmatota archaeon]